MGLLMSMLDQSHGLLQTRLFCASSNFLSPRGLTGALPQRMLKAMVQSCSAQTWWWRWSPALDAVRLMDD